jgi:hypothetical protein
MARVKRSMAIGPSASPVLGVANLARSSAACARSTCPLQVGDAVGQKVIQLGAALLHQLIETPQPVAGVLGLACQGGQAPADGGRPLRQHPVQLAQHGRQAPGLQKVPLRRR